MTEEVKLEDSQLTIPENKVVKNSKEDAKLVTITCPRCKTEITSSADILSIDFKAICPACLASFKLNYAARQEVNNLVNPSVEGGE